MKLTNFWENFDIILSKLKLYGSKTYWELYEYSKENTPKNILLFLLNQIKNNNEILNIFDYSETEKLNIINLINNKNNFNLVFENICVKSSGKIYKDITFINHEIYNPKNFKITTKEEPIGKFEKSTKTKYFCNDILFLTFTSGFDSYCSINKGVPSNIRNTVKKATNTSWDLNGLRSILGEDVTIGTKRRPGDFNDDYHDTTWGYTGPSKPSLSYIHKKFKEYFEFSNI
jgi:hypothetical protein